MESPLVLTASDCEKGVWCLVLEITVCIILLKCKHSSLQFYKGVVSFYPLFLYVTTVWMQRELSHALTRFC